MAGSVLLVVEVVITDFPVLLADVSLPNDLLFLDIKLYWTSKGYTPICGNNNFYLKMTAVIAVRRLNNNPIPPSRGCFFVLKFDPRPVFFPLPFETRSCVCGALSGLGLISKRNDFFEKESSREIFEKVIKED